MKKIFREKDNLNKPTACFSILLYYKLDTHWNYAGGYIGAKSLAQELGIEMPLLSEITMEPMLASEGDLTKMLNIRIKDGDIDYIISDINTFNVINNKWDFSTEFIYHTAGADSRKLFVRRDSFSSSLAPSLATQFENSMWVHSENFNQQQIFVFEVVERKERELEDFRISFIFSSIEVDENETKTIILEPFREGVVLNVPGYETGKICIGIFADQLGERVLEEAIIEY